MKKQTTTLSCGKGKMNKQAMMQVLGGAFVSCCMAPHSPGCVPGTCSNPRTGNTETCYCQRPIQ